MPKYIRADDVKIRVRGKVRFTSDIEDENKMSEQLLNRLIDEAEGQVEQDLSPRYMAPFAHCETGKYKDIPDTPTKNIIRTLCELMATIRVLETDFGSGSAVEASKYISKLQDRYDKIKDESILAKIHEDGRQWKFPPLPSLKLNYFNTEADDGYAGMILNTSQGDGNYPAKQINDPSESWVNGVIDDD